MGISLTGIMKSKHDVLYSKRVTEYHMRLKGEVGKGKDKKDEDEKQKRFDDKASKVSLL